jgi:hypothetical protein
LFRAGRPPSPPVAPSAPPAAVSASPGVSSGPRRPTIVKPPASAPAASADAQVSGPPSLSKRRIVGVLVSYSWWPDGKIFPVYEERNLIGRGQHCQIHVPEDNTMSEENSHIYVITHKRKYLMGERLGSANGTYLNGERIFEPFHPLPNYATIRAGSTDFIFILVQPPAGPAPEKGEGS